MGEAEARDLQDPQSKDDVIAVIGDGSLSGGLAFEGLNNATKVKGNLIIVVNDNEMSIDENQGGFTKGSRNCAHQMVKQRTTSSPLWALITAT